METGTSAVSKNALLIAAAGLVLCGCQSQLTCPRTIYLDGAGWYSGHFSVRKGLREAGYTGDIERFGWSSMLGPLPDHLLAGPDHPRVDNLADRITRLRRACPKGQIVLVGLSAGTGIVIHALERLPVGISVDYVVLLSPSISSRHDLTRALQHIRYRLYATSSPYDMILAAAPSAGLEGGRPAGQVGFQTPRIFTSGKRELYEKVVNLAWRPEYAAWGWDGGHTSATNSDFIRVVIAPWIMDEQPHPLDASIVER